MKREYQKAVDYICDLVRKGELTVGSRIPTERCLSSDLSISRNSTREALRMLENMGVIECRQGSGNYIAGDMSKNISSVIDMMILLKQTNFKEICSFRRNMDKAVCLSILENGSISRYEDKIRQILESEKNESDTVRQIKADQDFHYMLIEAAENQLWISLSRAIVSVYRSWIGSVIEDCDAQTKQKLFCTHSDILSALIKNDHDACQRAVDEHYDIVDKEMKRGKINEI